MVILLSIMEQVGATSVARVAEAKRQAELERVRKQRAQTYKRTVAHMELTYVLQLI
jgi:hypothetical protein